MSIVFTVTRCYGGYLCKIITNCNCFVPTCITYLHPFPASLLRFGRLSSTLIIGGDRYQAPFLCSLCSGLFSFRCRKGLEFGSYSYNRGYARVSACGQKYK